MSDLWHNAPALNRISDLLFAAAGLLVCYGLIRFAIVQPVFALNELHVLGSSGYIGKLQVESITKRDLRGTFFTVDIERLRTSFEKLPWVRKADVRRQWPDRIDVLIETHQPLARWGDQGKDGLVNVQGEVFNGEAAADAKLPLFAGPTGTSQEIALQYDIFRKDFAAIDRVPVQVRLTPRRAWQVRLDNGMTLEVGREQVPARVARFLAVYSQTIAPLGRNADYVDMRYTNGFAVRVPEIAKMKGAPVAARPKV